jgi:aspartate/methionine/tyrosine aminotransferase
MSASQTKRTIIQEHEANELLQAAALMPMQRDNRDLSVGQPTMPPDPAIIENATTALEEGQTHYVPVPGVDPLREALAHFLKEMGLESYAQDHVLVSAGVQEGRFLSIQMVGEAEGGIALPEVVHPGARKAAGVRDLDVQFMSVDAANGFLPTLSSMREALEGGCKLLYLESPVRLTGATFDADTVKEIAALLKEFDAGAIWDQGLAPWVEDYASLGAEPDMLEHVVVLGEAWPGVGLESWFVGYVAAKETWWEPMRSQKQIISICTSTPSQYAAVKAADVYADRHPEQRSELLSTRATVAQEAGELEVLPGEAASVVALQAPDAERAATALHEAGYQFADGADFGAPGVFRLAVTPEQTVLDALKRLQ